MTGRGMASRKATQGLEARYILGMRLGGNKEVQKSPFPAWEVPGRGRKPLGEGGSPLQWQVGAEDEHRAFPQPRRPCSTRGFLLMGEFFWATEDRGCWGSAWGQRRAMSSSWNSCVAW